MRQERTVISPSAAMAPAKMVERECLIARIAAMKNVLSPSSETMMTERDAPNACENSLLKKEKTPSGCATTSCSGIAAGNAPAMFAAWGATEDASARQYQ